MFCSYQKQKKGRLEVSPCSGGGKVLIFYKFWIFYRLVMPGSTDYLSFEMKVCTSCAMYGQYGLSTLL